MIVHRYRSYDHKHLTDAVSLLMANLEDALIQTGAEAGNDYTHRDLFEAAMRLMAVTWQKEPDNLLGSQFSIEHYPHECRDSGRSRSGDEPGETP